MMRAATRAIAIAALGAVALVGAPAVVAGPPEPGVPAPEGAQAKDFPRTPEEDEVWRLYLDNRLLTARRKVEELLAADSESIVGHYVLGQILVEAEGTLPQAMKHLGRARELYETKHGSSGRAASWWPLHREILFAIQRVAGELERHDYRLQILEYYDSLYDPNLPADRAWTLLHLRRFDEAKEMAAKAVADNDPQQKSLGLNVSCAIASFERDRAQWQKACAEAYASAKDRAQADSPFSTPDKVTSTTVHAYNAALASAAVLDFGQTEALALDGAKRLEFTAANPWRLLVDMYLAQGRLEESVSSAVEMQRWRRQQPPALRSQVRADSEATFASLLLVAGHTDRGLSAIDRAIMQPDRRGLTTATREQTLGAHALLRRALRLAHAEVLDERASWLGTTEALKARAEIAELHLEARADAERVIAVLSDDEMIVSTFELFTPRGLYPVPVWLLGDVVDIAGPDIVAVALELAQARADLDALDPYHDALLAEIAWRDGDTSEALSKAEAALGSLPDNEMLLRARVSAIAAEAAREDKNLAAALPYYLSAMRSDGGVLRRFGLELPARVESDSGEASQAAADLLVDSPRIDEQDGAFVIAISGGALEASACLSSPQGEQMFCVTAPPPPEPVEGEEPIPDDAEQVAARLAEAFHARAFAMPMQLSNIDLGSLDGTTAVSTEAAREHSHALLDELSE